MPISLELIGYCLLAVAAYLAVLGFLLSKVEKWLEAAGLWRDYPETVFFQRSLAMIIWDFITEFFMFALLPTLIYTWMWLILPLEGPRAGVAIGLWSVTIGSVPLAMAISSRLRLPAAALVFLTLSHLLKLGGALGIIGYLFSL